MKKLSTFILTLVLFSAFVPIADAHSGRTDSSGGHNCSAKSKAKGLCTGYHYHNGGKSSTKTKSTAKTAKKQESPAKPQLITADVYINGELQFFNQPAYIKNNTTLVPMRPIFEALGATVQYEDSTKKISGLKDKKTIVLSVGNKKAYNKINGVTSSVDLTHPTEITNGSTMVPLRILSESLGGNVQWDSVNRIVNITY